MIEMLFSLANVILCLGTLLQIRAVVNNKAALRGYSFVGSLLTAVPIGMFLSCYFMMDNWIAFWFGSVTFIYWLLVTVFTMVQLWRRFNENK